MMRLLICDTNILIDLEEGQLLEQFFQLPYDYRVPDILFSEELEEQHSYLPELGLQIGELTSQSMYDAAELIKRYGELSRNDCFSLALARQEQCPLLTGDQALRKAAEMEWVKTNGTIWAVNQLVKHQIIDKPEAKAAYIRMKANHRRLPWTLAWRQLEQLQMEK